MRVRKGMSWPGATSWEAARGNLVGARNILHLGLSCCYWVSGLVENPWGIDLGLIYFIHSTVFLSSLLLTTFKENSWQYSFLLISFPCLCPGLLEENFKALDLKGRYLFIFSKIHRLAEIVHFYYTTCLKCIAEKRQPLNCEIRPVSMTTLGPPYKVSGKGV